MKASTIRAMEAALSTLKMLGTDSVTATPIALLSEELAKRDEDEPAAAWMANTGTAGRGEGCDRPFWLKEDAVAYVRQHGGYVKPLSYAAPHCWFPNWPGGNPDGPTAA